MITMDQAGYPLFADDPTAACRGADPSLFFPEGPGRRWGEDDLAKAICRACPLLKPCRAYALPIVNLSGTWGGMTASERETWRRNHTGKEHR